MRFKAFTVTQADFDSWIAHQEQPAVGATASATTQAAAISPDSAAKVSSRCRRSDRASIRTRISPLAPRWRGPRCRRPASPALACPPSAGAVNTQVTQAGFVAFPREKIPAYAVPQTPLPASLRVRRQRCWRRGNAANGAKLVHDRACASRATRFAGSPMMQAVIGPNLTHVGVAHDDRRRALPERPAAPRALGQERQRDEAGRRHADVRHRRVRSRHAQGPVKPTTGGFTDQQIADIVAYLQSLK